MNGILPSLLELCITAACVYIFAESAKRTRTLHDGIGFFFFRMLVPFPLTIGMWGALFATSLDYSFPHAFGIQLQWVVASLVLTAIGTLFLFYAATDMAQSWIRNGLGAILFATCLLLAQGMLITAMNWQPPLHWNLPALLLPWVTLQASGMGLIWLSTDTQRSFPGQSSLTELTSLNALTKLGATFAAVISFSIAISFSLLWILDGALLDSQARSLTHMEIDTEWMKGFVGLIVLSVFSVMLLASALSDRAERRANKLAKELSDNEDVLKKVQEIDLVTRLRNRAAIEKYLQEFIQEAHKKQELFSVFYIGLDAFRLVNDSLGYSSGDILLAAAAARIKRVLTSQDVVARAGGDEFVIVSKGCKTAQQCSELGNRLLDVLSDPYEVSQQNVTLSASVGVALYPQDGHSSQELLTHANYAMSNVKRSGRNNLCFYVARMETTARHDFQLQSELRTALQERQMEMHFQPQFDISTMSLVGCEALMRWRLPGNRLRMPDSFISLAERTGLIVMLGNQALELSCEAAYRWYDQLGYWIWMGVNVSPIQFQQPDFVDTVARVIERVGIAPKALVLEVTETTAMSNAESTLQKFEQLNALGVRIAIDDFGTGYSSLAYLKRFRFHHIKIDRSFIRDLEQNRADQHIVKAIIDLANNFGVEAVAEGVSRTEQHELLQALNCPFGQGYFYGRPQIESDFVRQFLLSAIIEVDATHFYSSPSIYTSDKV